MRKILEREVDQEHRLIRTRETHDWGKHPNEGDNQRKRAITLSIEGDELA